VIWLSIESSCDETAVAVLRDDGSVVRVLANPLYSQGAEHAAWGGVVPESASRSHLHQIVPIAQEAVRKSGVPLAEIDAVAYTRGPGLMGSLLVGANFARGLATALGKPAYGIHHIEGHIAGAWLSHQELRPPFVALTVSGGHTELLLVEEPFRYTLLGGTRDDAAGEAFDKCGKLLGLGYPAGAAVGRRAQGGDPCFVDFPRALKNSASLELSFSGLKTAVLRFVETHGNDFVEAHKASICASLQEAIVDILAYKAGLALKKTGAKTLVLSGGVSANAALRGRLFELCQKRGFSFASPELAYCTDNAAMIGAAAILRHRQGALPQEETPVTAWLEL
jgi:N6-L-threonylcarbamoyladenine synthase